MNIEAAIFSKIVIVKVNYSVISDISEEDKIIIDLQIIFGRAVYLMGCDALGNIFYRGLEQRVINELSKRNHRSFPWKKYNF